MHKFYVKKGRILNRFSKDVGFLDDLLPLSFINYLFVSNFMCYSCTVYVQLIKISLLNFQLLTRFFAIILTAAAANYWILLPAALVMVIFLVLRWYYLKTARDVKRLEAIGKFQSTQLKELLKFSCDFIFFVLLFFSSQSPLLAHLHDSARTGHYKNI